MFGALNHAVCEGRAEKLYLDDTRKEVASEREKFDGTRFS